MHELLHLQGHQHFGGSGVDTFLYAVEDCISHDNKFENTRAFRIRSVTSNSAPGEGGYGAYGDQELLNTRTYGVDGDAGGDGVYGNVFDGDVAYDADGDVLYYGVYDNDEVYDDAGSLGMYGTYGVYGSYGERSGGYGSGLRDESEIDYDAESGFYGEGMLDEEAIAFVAQFLT